MEPTLFAFMDEEEAARGVMKRSLPFRVTRGVRIESLEVEGYEGPTRLQIYVNLPIEDAERKNRLYLLESIEMPEGATEVVYEAEDDEYLPLSRPAPAGFQLRTMLCGEDGEPFFASSCEIHLSFL